jgi:hypothetical protein
MNLLEFFSEKNKYKLLKLGFEKACVDNNCEFKVFCKDSKNNDIFRCTHEAGDSFPKLAILSGLHGDEPGGPHGILKFLLDKNNYKNINLLSIPVLNPHGIERHIRRDSANKDLNRQWDSNDRKIVAKTKKMILKFSPNALLSLHEDESVDGFYLYPSKGFSDGLLKKTVSILKKHLEPIEDGSIHGDPVKNGIVSNPNVNKPKHHKSMEFFFEKRKIPNITLELPSRLPLDKRTKIYCDVLTGICKHF